MKKLVGEIFRWFYWYPFRWVVEWIPIHSTYRLAVILSKISGILPQGKLFMIHQGIRKIFPDIPESEIQAIVHATLRNYYLNASEVFHYPQLNQNVMNQWITYEGLDKLDTALKSGKGVILAHGHFGNEELLMPGIGYQGYTTNQLGSRWEPPQETGFASGFINSIRKKAFQKRIGYRETFPVTFHYVDQSLRSAIRAIKNNEVMLFAVDGREGNQWIPMDFLHQKANFSPGLPKLALMTGAIVLPVFLVRQPDFRHRLIIHDPIPTHGRTEEQILHDFLSLLEQSIRQNPEQYAKVFFLVQDFFLKDS